MATALPLETQTLYAELLEHLIGVHAQRSIGRLTGSFAEKTIKGERYRSELTTSTGTDIPFR
jgi:hypothetical protein